MNIFYFKIYNFSPFIIYMIMFRPLNVKTNITNYLKYVGKICTNLCSGKMFDFVSGCFKKNRSSLKKITTKIIFGSFKNLLTMTN
jgi:hypothetical protein